MGARDLRSLLSLVEIRDYSQFTFMFLLEFEGIDSLLWEQAKKDNPDPQRYKLSSREMQAIIVIKWRALIDFFKVSLS